jgi:hypothetical protein
VVSKVPEITPVLGLRLSPRLERRVADAPEAANAVAVPPVPAVGVRDTLEPFVEVSVLEFG